MALNNFKKSFEMMLGSEGGYSDLASDPGNRLADGRKGCTNLGVTQSTWENFIGRQSDEKEMRGLTPYKVEPLYRNKYWNAVRADELPSGIDYLVFDFAVNAGPGSSIKTLQSAVGAQPDGDFGKLTMAAVQLTSPQDLIKKFSQAKENFYRSLDAFDTFGKGWLNRLAEVEIKASAMV